jgi:hypothetical protein
MQEGTVEWGTMITPSPPDPSFASLLPFFFPPDLLAAFSVTDHRIVLHPKTGEETIEITLEEKNAPPVIPDEHRGKRITSQGFHRPITLQDFPIRDRFCLLVVRRRRWEIDGVGTLERVLSFLPDTGLKITTQFAAFLKEADRTRTGGDRTHRETVWGEEA